MEGRLGVLWITRKEELEERVYVLTGSWAVVDGRTIAGVRITNVYRLVKENDVGVRVPTEFVVFKTTSLIGDGTRTKFKEETSC